MVAPIQGARVSSNRVSGPDCLPNGGHWYAKESEHNKQKLMEGLGCYCKKAGQTSEMFISFEVNYLCEQFSKNACDKSSCTVGHILGDPLTVILPGCFFRAGRQYGGLPKRQAGEER